MYKTKFIGLSFLSLKVLRNHLWVSPIILSAQTREEEALVSRAPHPSGACSPPIGESNSIRRLRMRWRESAGSAWRSQMREIRRGTAEASAPCGGEWWQTMCSTMVCLDMCLMRYVSWRQTRRRTGTHTPLAGWDAQVRRRSADSLRCTLGRTCCSRRPWRF